MTAQTISPREQTSIRAHLGGVLFCLLLAGCADPVTNTQPIEKIEIAAPPQNNDSCTEIAFRSDKRSSCDMGSKYNTCIPCREQFEAKCNAFKYDDESLEQCVLRVITEQNVCVATDLLPDGTKGIGVVERRGEVIYERDCRLDRHPKAIPHVRYYRSHCRDFLGPNKTNDAVEECVTGMVEQWESGIDFPNPRRIEFLNTRPQTQKTPPAPEAIPRCADGARSQGQGLGG